MKFAFILDPLDSLKIYKDSSYMMMQEAQSRGHALFMLHQEDLILKDGVVVGDATLAEDVLERGPHA